uniref:ATP synthase beta chain n=1 Tax=Arundo donax TaxID=35708 RepID=A0A0A9CTU1_ARUDO
MTPLSIISLYRSLPSRVRSPTPAKTEKPPWALATLLINSMIRTVLPTPAPPKRPILPPL